MMKTRKKMRILWVVLIAMIFLNGCKKKTDNEVITPPDQGSFTNGVFICNEGLFQSGTGTVSFYSRLTKSVRNDLYAGINQVPLGNIVQSMAIINNLGYIVVNNANKVEIVNMSNFKSVATISDISLPRFIIPVTGQKAYLTNWGNTVAVIDLLTNTVVKNIATGTGPERMLKLGERVYVLNQGGFGIDSTMTVIDCTTDAYFKTLALYPKPSGIVSDNTGMIWVLCSGKGYNGFPAADDTKAHLLCIDPDSFQVIRDLIFPDNTNHPDKLCLNAEGDKLFYLFREGIYEFGINDAALKTVPFVTHTGSLYALGVDPATQFVYASDPVDYTQNGWVYRYHPVTGMVVDSFKTGIVPTFFCFN
jgi:YVTN family beta-propeller protein